MSAPYKVVTSERLPRTKIKYPPIAQYQKSHRKLNSIFSAYRNSEIEFPVPITLKDLTGIPNREMWLELTKKFIDCFDWQTQKKHRSRNSSTNRN